MSDYTSNLFNSESMPTLKKTEMTMFANRMIKVLIIFCVNVAMSVQVSVSSSMTNVPAFVVPISGVPTSGIPTPPSITNCSVYDPSAEDLTNQTLHFYKGKDNICKDLCPIHKQINCDGIYCGKVDVQEIACEVGDSRLSLSCYADPEVDGYYLTSLRVHCEGYDDFGLCVLKDSCWVSYSLIAKGNYLSAINKQYFIGGTLVSVAALALIATKYNKKYCTSRVVDGIPVPKNNGCRTPSPTDQTAPFVCNIPFPLIINADGTIDEQSFVIVTDNSQTKSKATTESGQEPETD